MPGRSARGTCIPLATGVQSHTEKTLWGGLMHAMALCWPPGNPAEPLRFAEHPERAGDLPERHPVRPLQAAKGGPRSPGPPGRDGRHFLRPTRLAARPASQGGGARRPRRRTQTRVLPIGFNVPSASAMLALIAERSPGLTMVDQGGAVESRVRGQGSRLKLGLMAEPKEPLQ